MVKKISVSNCKENNKDLTELLFFNLIILRELHKELPLYLESLIWNYTNWAFYESNTEILHQKLKTPFMQPGCVWIYNFLPNTNALQLFICRVSKVVSVPCHPYTSAKCALELSKLKWYVKKVRKLRFSTKKF